MNSVSLLKIAPCLALSAVLSAHAAELGVAGTDAFGLPGDIVFVTLTYNYGAGMEVVVEDLQLQYENAGLRFLHAASTMQVLGEQLGLPQYVGVLRQFAQEHQGAVLENFNPILGDPQRSGYALSFYTVDGVGHSRSGDVEFRAAFEILPAAAPGVYTVSFPSTNLIVDHLETEYSYPGALQFLSVTVVPEPASALLILSGLALVGGVTRVRTQR